MIRLRIYKPQDTLRAALWAEKHPERIREIKRAWKKRNKMNASIRGKNYYRKKSYGMTLDEYNARLIKQGNTCSICQLEMKRSSLDHNHETGTVREFLCNRCNSCLHLLEEPGLKDRAIQFLDDWRAIELAQKAYA